MDIDKALADDPDVYSYDELYDDMKKKEKEQVEERLNISKNAERKVSVYISFYFASTLNCMSWNLLSGYKKLKFMGQAIICNCLFFPFSYSMISILSSGSFKLAKFPFYGNIRLKTITFTKQAKTFSFYRNLYKQTVCVHV